MVVDLKAFWGLHGFPINCCFCTCSKPIDRSLCEHQDSKGFSYSEEQKGEDIAFFMGSCVHNMLLTPETTDYTSHSRNINWQLL